jgi:hypothetical protein
LSARRNADILVGKRAPALTSGALNSTLDLFKAFEIAGAICADTDVGVPSAA